MLAKQRHFRAACTTTFPSGLHNHFPSSLHDNFSSGLRGTSEELARLLSAPSLDLGLHTTTARSRAARKPLRANRLARASARRLQAASKRDGTLPFATLEPLICRALQPPQNRQARQRPRRRRDETLKNRVRMEAEVRIEARKNGDDDAATTRRRSDNDDATMNRVHLDSPRSWCGAPG